MSNDYRNKLGVVLTRVGEEALKIVGGPSDSIYLYVEIGEGWVGPSLFKDEGSQVRYHDFPYESDLWRLLMDAWDLDPAEKRWTGLEYTVDGGKFDAKFSYDDVENPNEGSDERRKRFLRARYGDKPVIYPPMDIGATEYFPPK